VVASEGVPGKQVPGHGVQRNSFSSFHEKHKALPRNELGEL